MRLAVGLILACAVLTGCSKSADTSARLSDWITRADGARSLDELKKLQTDWMARIRALVARGEIHTGMPVADLEAMLGSPTGRGDGWAEWVFKSSEHVNPAFIASTNGGVVAGFRQTAK